jgi:hypothetical protein
METSPQAVYVNANPNVDGKEFLFRFKKDKLGNKRANVKCENVPVPSAEGIVEILRAGGKQLELLQEVVSDTVRGVLADYVSDENFAWEKFDVKQISWEAIANMPKEGKTERQVTLASEVYIKKMAPLKTDKPTLEKLKGQLAIYAENSQRAEEFQEILDLLLRRIDTYMRADDPAELANAL